jgi:benzoyl-CoA reductase/2-hydroxyglutaryl-CoA dehydratase subunit BcrC/BadD/HgdB
MRDYYRAEFRKLVSFLEEQTGNKLDEERLRAVCEEVKKQDEYIAELYDLRRAVPNPFPAIFNLMLFGTRFMATGTPEATEVMKTMYEVTKERYKRGQGVLPEEKVRVGLVYLSHFTTGGEFWKWLENNGISLIIEGLSLFNHQHYHMDCSTLDTMLDGLADQLSNMPMTKQIRGPYDYPGQWLDDVVTVSNDLKIDCAVYLGTMGCKNTWGCIKVLMRRIEEDLGIPTLIIQSDSWDDRVTPWPVIKDQIEEFINTVVL